LDMEDTIQQQNQISDSLASSLVNTMDDSVSNDDSLMRELMAMMGDDDDVLDEYVTVIDPPVATAPGVVLPSTPSAFVQNVHVDNSMHRIMEEDDDINASEHNHTREIQMNAV
jgi:hypothetical protein